MQSASDMEDPPPTADSKGLRVAVEGCGHGTLDAIYASIEKSCEIKGWDGVDLVIICGDFQAVRDRLDLNMTAMPAKYREMADFHQYYWGKKHAPYLTIFIGGNHEASNHLWELYFGGWVAPNIYYLGAANVIRVGPLKIAGLSGIWKGYDYRKPHYERLPYNSDDMYSIYHVRELDARKLLAYRSQVDIGLSHDWPHGVEWLGNSQQLFRAKPFLREDAESGKLGNVAAEQILDHLRPGHWFSAHLHTRYAAVKHFQPNQGEGKLIDGPMNGNTNQNSLSTKSAHSTFDNMELTGRSQNEEKVSAWQNFHIVARENEARENAQALKEQRSRLETSQRTGVAPTSGNVYNEVYKKVKLADGFSRAVTSISQNVYRPEKPSDEAEAPEKTIAQLDGCASSAPFKRHRDSDPNQPILSDPDTVASKLLSSGSAPTVPNNGVSLINPDAIDLDLSDDEDTTLASTRSESNPQVQDASIIATNGNQQAPLSSRPDELATSLPKDVSTVQEPASESQCDSSRNTDIVSEEMRAQLAALSTKFAAQEPTTQAQALTNDIQNTTTKFLALSKCVPGQEFLQLLEIEPNQAPAAMGKQPYQLEYDPEWLAILRVFSAELTLGGDPSARTPRHQGDVYYRDRILEEEKWIYENVVANDLLKVPLNFEITLTQSEPTSIIDQSEMPVEATNPQTSAFCSLIGIENKFDFSEEDRAARRDAGPRPSNRQDRGHNTSRGGGHFHRGNRGRGRGSGSRGRGRGRSQRFG